MCMSISKLSLPFQVFDYGYHQTWVKWINLGVFILVLPTPVYSEINAPFSEWYFKSRKGKWTCILLPSIIRIKSKFSWNNTLYLFLLIENLQVYIRFFNQESFPCTFFPTTVASSNNMCSHFIPIFLLQHTNPFPSRNNKKIFSHIDLLKT